MNQLKGKHLLILGGDTLSADIIRAAKKEGVFTTVIDWHPVDISPSKLLADQYFNISIKDYDAVDQLIHDQKIDGVITGFTDSYLEPYAEICKRNNLPSYASKDLFKKTLDKKIFKDYCKKYNIPIVPEYDINDILKSEKLPASKILIKPVDSSGSRGIVLVTDYSDIAASLDESLSFSTKKEVVVERYMDMDDVSMCYTIQNGEISLSAICDRYIHKTEKFGSVTSGLIYPSQYLQRYVEEVDSKVRRMFKEMGIMNGVLFLQAFVDKDSFYFYEMGYRLSGGRHYIFTEEENGVSAIRALVNFALTGDMGIDDLENSDRPDFKNIYSQISVLCKSQTITEIKGLEKIKLLPGVLDVSLRYNEGDKVGKEGTTMQIVARIHLKASDVQEMQELICSIQSLLMIKGEYGENIIEDFFQVPISLYEG